MLFSYLAHKKACAAKQNERRARINFGIQAEYRKPIRPEDARILAEPVSSLVELVQAGKMDPCDILMATASKP
ncbi:hypothetical protein LshimejAT787_0601530 [Lyophyllum shimeji]|uniref:Uncharacterized protein n=1 Tax=Lyophyllum shimeji TaxID=47721 RepID=A0A9P3PNR0_LYOSH|nr:hypothetical protein LshimejAT787_0601530 [Lyophyllum shimeji]